MKLNAKLLITYAVVGIVLLLAMGYYVGVNLREDKFQSIFDSYVSQLYHVDFAITSFLIDVEYDVQDLVANEVVRTRDDHDFTSFLDADEATFEYNIGQTEQAIIDTLNTYRTNHPYANSVYMGRENGSFVRSHKRARPTQYDPRERPWYQLAVSDPDEVMRTVPYRSVTTPDVNIGTVKALVDEQGELYGVVGIDITLRNLTDYISDISVGAGGHIVLVDDSGIVLTAQDEQVRFKMYDEAGLDYFQAAMDNEVGYLLFEKDGKEYYLFYYTSPELGWKISAIVPVEEIDRQVSLFVGKVPLLFSFSLLLLGGLMVLVVNRFIVQPVKELEQNAQAIIKTGNLDHRIAVETSDEIGQLAHSFNEMVDSIKETSEELSASEEKYRSLVENVNVGVFRTTVDGQLLHANSAAIRIMGFDSATTEVNVSMEDIYEDPADRELLIQHLEMGESVKDQELRLVKRDGTPIWVSLSVTAQYAQDGSVKWLEGVLEDINARKLASESLRHARDELEQRVAERTAELEERNAELDAFAHTVAHNLKNPTGIIVGYAEVLEQDLALLSDEKIRMYLRLVAQSGRKVSVIVDELLLLASVREIEEIETEPLDMARIVAEVQRRLTDLIDEFQGEIIVPDSWPAAEGHAPWVEEVWTNYVSNALQYGGSPPHIELGAEVEPDGWVRFWVSDNGPGLSAEEQARLFTPFERLHQARAKGHGLGLSIVQRIVQKLGGQVGVECGEQGCTFYFTLPSSSAPSPPVELDNHS